MTRMDFSRWEANITVSVWGRAKATLVDSTQCPEQEPPGAQYRGDCDNCGNFMGVKFPDGTSHVVWGSRYPACCWKRVQP